MNLLKQAPLLFVVICILLLGVFYSEEAQEEERLLDWLEQNGILDDAYVQKCVTSSRGGSKVTYQYEVEVSNEVLEYTSREMVRSCTNYQKGDVIKIRYVANMPGQSRIEGNDKSARAYHGLSRMFYYFFLWFSSGLLSELYDRFIGRERGINIFLYIWLLLMLLPLCYAIIDFMLWICCGK